jgi:hypothetical protein
LSAVGLAKQIALDHDMPFVGLPIFSEKVYHFSIGRKDFLSVEPQSGLSFLFLLGAPRFA